MGMMVNVFHSESEENINVYTFFLLLEMAINGAPVEVLVRII